MKYALLCLALLSLAMAQEPYNAPVHTPNQVKVAASESAKRIVKRVEPIYPTSARAACIKGDVTLTIIVATNGYVKSAIPTSGPGELRKAAKEAVSQWQYEPYLLNGKAVEQRTTSTINFRLPQFVCPPNKA